MQEQKPNWLLLAVIVGGFLFYTGKLDGLVQPSPNVVTVGVPSAEMQGFVAPIKAKLSANKPKAAVVNAFYRDFAGRVKADGGKVLTSTAIFATAHQRLLDFGLAGTAYNGAPEIGTEIDDAITKALGGKQQLQLDAAKRARLVEVLEAISWAGN